MAAKAKPDPQGGLFDRTIEDPELEAALEDLESEEIQAGFDAYRKAHKQVYDRLNTISLEHDEKVRVGRFIVTAKERRGGGFEIPAWTKTGIGSITRIED
jgi:hypothetical protein